MSEIINLTVTNGQPTTTSLAITEHFGKRHADVLRAIEGLECSKEFNERNFAPVAYKGGNGELRPMYAITKDGFMFLAMGFTGKEAAAWKERFIAAFNAMERHLLQNAAAQQIQKPYVALVQARKWTTDQRYWMRQQARKIGCNMFFLDALRYVMAYMEEEMQGREHVGLPITDDWFLDSLGYTDFSGLKEWHEHQQQ